MKRLCSTGLLLALIVTADRPASTQRRGPIDPYAVPALCTALPSAAGRQVPVATGDELQAALDGAVAGDTIVLQAGATFHPVAADGSFVLRNRPLERGQWITLRSSSGRFDAGGGTPPGTRVESLAGGDMPQIRATVRNVPAIRTDPGAHGYRLIGLDIGADPGVDQVNVVELGSATETIASNQPADIVVDRCYIHGNDTGSYRRGVALNGARLAVIDSTVSDFHDRGSDSQALAGWNGPGPFTIDDNYLEAASENILFGGGDPAIPNLVPSDIQIRRNFSTKRPEWRTAGVPVKNAFELKNARRVLVEGNTFENVWPGGQDGTAILLKSTNQDGRCTWCVTEYVTFRNNIVRSAAQGVVINAAETGARGQPMPVPANHIKIQNVLFEGIGAPPYGGGKLFRIFGGVDHVEITHVTSTGNPAGILDARDVHDLNPHLTFTYNIVERHLYGIGAGGDEGTPTLSRNFAPFVYNENVLVNTSASTGQAVSDAALKSRYPAVTYVANGWQAVGLQSGTNELADSSPYYRAGIDGESLGADVDAIAAAQAGPSTDAPCRPMAVPRVP